MRLIKPSEISAKILTLFDESDERLILVSPYIKISKWYKLTSSLNRLNSRGIPIEIYVRDDPDNIATYRDLEKLALPYTKIPHLHTKVYLNEKNGIATSMNLLLSSEFNSLEFGYEIETREEYNDLARYFHKYVHKTHHYPLSTQRGGSHEMLAKSICENLENASMNAWTWFEQDILHVSTGSSEYIISINDGALKICSSLKTAISQRKISPLYTSQVSKKIKDLTAMKIDIFPGLIPDIMMVSGLAHRTLKSPCIKWIREDEKAYVVKSICKFIRISDDPLILEVTESSGT